MTVIVIVITRPAANFGRLRLHQRNDGMVGEAATLDAIIVDDIA